MSNSGVRLEGNVSKLCSYPDNCKTIVDMCYQDGILYASFQGQNDSGGLISLDSSNNTFQRMVENTGTYDISGICCYKGGVLFLDMKGRKLRLYEGNKRIADIPGKGVDGNATGSAAYSSFGQPVGIAVENDTNIYITDAKYGAIK